MSQLCVENNSDTKFNGYSKSIVLVMFSQILGFRLK